MSRSFFLINFIFIFLFACNSLDNTQLGKQHHVSFDSPEELEAYFTWQPNKKPLIGAHRGGIYPELPENSIGAFEKSLTYAPCLLECDVQKTKDNILVIFHDDTLQRTTNGKGKVSEFTLAELKNLHLKNNQGEITRQKITTLEEILVWAQGKAILQLDIKKTVDPLEILKLIDQYQAECYTIVITYNLADAIAIHDANPNLMISASATDMEGINRLLASSINRHKLLGFVGVTEPDKDIYQLLHENGIMAILGTIGNLDRKAQRHGETVYKKLLKNGADIIATDNVPVVSKVIDEFVKQKKSATGSINLGSFSLSSFFIF
jgi:glycerophosphoryl diester phosphodiesterase